MKKESKFPFFYGYVHDIICLNHNLLIETELFGKDVARWDCQKQSGEKRKK